MVQKFHTSIIRFVSQTDHFEPKKMYLLNTFSNEIPQQQEVAPAHSHRRSLSLSFNRGHNDVQETSDLSVESLDSMSDGCADGFPSSEKH